MSVPEWISSIAFTAAVVLFCYLFAVLIWIKLAAIERPEPWWVRPITMMIRRDHRG